MGNQSSRPGGGAGGPAHHQQSRGGSSSSSSHGPVLVAEALQPLPPHLAVNAVLGGVDRREHMILRAAPAGLLGGALGGKYVVRDLKADANAQGGGKGGKGEKIPALLKSETKSSRKRNTTTITSGSSGGELLTVYGTHECFALRRGCVVTPQGIRGGSDNDQSQDSNVVAGSIPNFSRSKSNVSLGGSSSNSGGSSAAAASDVAFVARALDPSFFHWMVEVYRVTSTSSIKGQAGSGLVPPPPSSPGSSLTPGQSQQSIASLYITENPALGSIDFYLRDPTQSGSSSGVSTPSGGIASSGVAQNDEFLSSHLLVARAASSPGGHVLCKDWRYPVGSASGESSSSYAIIVAPGMDWVVVSTISLVLFSRKRDHDAGVATREGSWRELSDLPAAAALLSGRRGSGSSTTSGSNRSGSGSASYGGLSTSSSSNNQYYGRGAAGAPGQQRYFHELSVNADGSMTTGDDGQRSTRTAATSVSSTSSLVNHGAQPGGKSPTAGEHPTLPGMVLPSGGSPARSGGGGNRGAPVLRPERIEEESPNAGQTMGHRWS